jgi:hypothetical protein
MVVTLNKPELEDTLELELLNRSSIASSINPANKIGEGKYRDVYQVRGKALKILKPHVHKFNLEFPTSVYTKLKFGIADFNQYEYHTYRKFIKEIPNKLKDRFAQIYWAGPYNGKSVSLSELVINSNGEVSESLSESGPVYDKNFWDAFNQVESLLLEKRIFLMDIHAKNIMVKESEGKLAPVLIDYKRVGARTYPLQIWLLSQSRLAEKLKRKFQRLREEYSPD